MIEEDIQELRRDVDALEKLTLTLLTTLPDDKVAKLLSTLSSRRVLAYLVERTGDTDLRLEYDVSGVVCRQRTIDALPNSSPRRYSVGYERKRLAGNDPVRALIEALNDLGADINV